MSERVQGYHLPGACLSTQTLDVGAIGVEMATLDPARLTEVIDALMRGATDLRARSPQQVLATIDRIVTMWLDPTSTVRQRADAVLPMATGFSPAMVAHGLPLLLEPLRAAAIDALLHAELGHRAIRRPTLITHVLAGNIPGLAAAPMLLSLAVQSAALVKSAAGDPIFPALLAQSIAEVDEALGAAVAVAHWRGGDHALEAVAFGAADLVVASGSDAAIEAIAARVPRRFIGHGHKVSFAAIGADRLSDTAAAADLAQRLAYDVSLWDQQGCLSPQLCYVEAGGRVTPSQFSELLAQQLARYAVELPPRRLRFEEHAAVQRFRQEAQWGLHGATTLLASPGDTAWSISLENGPTFLPTCLDRCIRLKVVTNLCELEAALLPHRRHLEAAGIAVAPAKASVVADMLARTGVHHVCPLGMMQRPPLTWRQGGRPRVGDWVEESVSALESRNFGA